MLCSNQRIGAHVSLTCTNDAGYKTQNTVSESLELRTIHFSKSDDVIGHDRIFCISWPPRLQGLVLRLHNNTVATVMSTCQAVGII